jgi:hypothetical protein
MFAHAALTPRLLCRCRGNGRAPSVDTMIASHDERESVARAAFTSLGPNPSEHARLQVSCGRSHHLAAVYDTAKGPVFRSVLHAHAHGKRDFIDTGHGGSPRGLPWYDLLDAGSGPAVDDELPAGCECGPYTLSRTLLLGHIADGERHIVLN